jgi:proline racemase
LRNNALPMSGSNAICVVTALLESGRLAMRQPETVVRLATAAGLVVARAQGAGGRCLSVSLDNVPAFVEALDVPVATKAWRTVRADIAFDGVYCALVVAHRLGKAITPDNARALAEAGMELKARLAGQVRVRHPEIPGLDGIAHVMFRADQPDGSLTTCTTLKPGRLDRSPCGPGSSANLAVLHARGRLAVGESRVSRSVTGGVLTAEVIGETTVGGRPAVLPRITGQAWVFGRPQLRISPGDPFPAGVMLSDGRGPQVGTL